MSELPCLPLIKERFWNNIKILEEYENIKLSPDIQIFCFPQLWGSTALGFSGFGGQAMTTAYTTVAADINTGIYGVFFEETLAYIIKNPNEQFYEDLSNHKMVEVFRKSIYEK